MKKNRYVFHVDVNSAFLSWSAVYKTCVLGENQDLRAVPSIVGGDQEKRHGIVLAKSIPAKRYGIQTGEPVIAAQKKCPGLIIIPPDYGLYVTASRAFIMSLKKYSDMVIQYSIDEAWVVFEGFERIYGRGQMVNLAYQMKDEIRETLGFTVNIGVSTNFLFSKMAGDFSKPDKVHTLFPDEINKKMWPLPVSDLFMVGKATTLKLNRFGIRTIGDLACAESGFIKAHLKRPGEILQNYAQGGDLEPYIFNHDMNKGYGNSMTAPKDITDTGYAEHLLLSLCETVAARLRQDNVKAGELSIHITTYEFQHFAKQKQLMSSTDVTEELFKEACIIFRALWDNHTPIRQIGVHVSKVSADIGRQYNLFDLQKYDRLEKLNHTVDAIRKKYGEDAIMRASFLKDSVPHMGGGLDKERRSGVTVGINIMDEKVRKV